MNHPPHTSSLLILLTLSVFSSTALAETTDPGDHSDRLHVSPKEAPSPLAEEEVVRHWRQTPTDMSGAIEGKHFVLFNDHTFYLEEYLSCQAQEGQTVARRMIDATGHWALTSTGITLTIKARRLATSATCECHHDIARTPCYYTLEDVVTEETPSQHHAAFTHERHPRAPYDSSPTVSIDDELFFGDARSRTAESFFNSKNERLPDAFVEALGCRQVTYEQKGEKDLVRLRCGDDTRPAAP